VPRAALRALPGIIQRTEKPVPPLPEADLETLPFAALLAAHPLDPQADMIVLRANDRWRSYWTLDFISSHRPWLLLAVDGKTPAEGWPQIEAHAEALAPYLANISASDAPPAWDGYTPAHGMANSTQVVEIIAVRQSEYFAAYAEGPLAAPSPLVAEGRRLFLANCVTCHQGPGNVGGNLSRRPFMILQTHAAYNAPYFRSFVANPKSLMPDTIMPPHPQFSSADYDALIAFITALPPVPPPTP
jgi:mono/diheme cytochrome c family protein